MNSLPFSYDIGDLVFASNSGDMSWNESWTIGRITEFDYPNGIRIDGHFAVWLYYVKIFKDTADLVSAAYRDRKGSVFLPIVAESMLAGSYKFSTEAAIDVDGMTITQRDDLIQELKQANGRENRRIFEDRAAIILSWFDNAEDARHFCQAYLDWMKE